MKYLCVVCNFMATEHASLIKHLKLARWPLMEFQGKTEAAVDDGEQLELVDTVSGLEVGLTD
jgi:hypothetical protein